MVHSPSGGARTADFIGLHLPALSFESDSVVRLATGSSRSIHSLVGYPQTIGDSA